MLAPLGLLINPQVNFSRDWPTHFWMVEFYGDYFRAHGGFPIVMNNSVAVGVAVPVFYTWLLYPLLGMLAAVIGTGMALRVALVAMVTIQFFAVLGAGRKIFGHAGLAIAVATSVIWATYSLTNLYNRGALAEYFAAGFFCTSIGFAASAAVMAGSVRRFHAWLAGFFLLLALGTHPPTAVLGGAFTVLLAAACSVGTRGRLFKMSRRGALYLAAGLLAGALILSPWVYASVALGSRLVVTQGTQGFIFQPDQNDSFGHRFAPFPYDTATMKYGVYGDDHGTPYLEAPINFVLLGILMWTLVRLRWSLGKSRDGRAGDASLPRAILVVALGWFFLLAAISVSPPLAGFFAFLAPYVQYVYRLVTHCNAALLVGIFAAGFLVSGRGGDRRFRHETNMVVAIGVTIAIVGLGIKLQHGAATALPADNLATVALGNPVDLTRAYATPGMLRSMTVAEVENAVPLRFPVERAGPRFGDMGSATIQLGRARWVVTNAVVFPWMTLEIDGKKPDAHQLARLEHFVAIYLPAGVHEIRPVWRPDPVWSVLHRLSQACFLVTLVFTVAWGTARLGLHRKHEHQASPALA